MRKHYKKKLRSCAMCKPHKMAKAKRWRDRDLARMNRDEKEMRDLAASPRGEKEEE